jgi:uncharacterized protein YbjQ (UPF0145 family)
MSFPILTTTQYDPAKYIPVGSISINQVESLSLFRSVFGGIGATFGGPNSMIQEAINRLQARSMDALIHKIQQTYPNTILVNSLHSDISHITGDNNSGSYIIMTMTATCYVPTSTIGGNKRRTFKKRGNM